MNTFGQLFKKYRLKAEFATIVELVDAFAEKGYLYEVSTFYRWQKGERIPTRRDILLTLIAVFTERNAICSLLEANSFLESAGHGYLTKKEQIKLIPI